MSNFIERTSVRNSWVIKIYPDCVDDIGFESKAIGVNIFVALDKAQQIFGDDYNIIVQNVNIDDEEDIDNEPTCDFSIKRKVDGYPVGDIEFWPHNYEPISTEEISNMYSDNDDFLPEDFDGDF